MSVAAPAELFDLALRGAKEAGRDPNAVEMTASLPDDLAQIPSLVQLGVKRILVPVSPMAGLKTVIASPQDCARWKPIIEQYAD